MKKKLLIIFFFVLNQLHAMERFTPEEQKRIHDIVAKIKRNDHELQQQSMRAEQRTLQFKKFIPQKKMELPAFKRMFPALFTGIPEKYHQKIIDYAQNLYGDGLFKNLEEINKKGTDAIRQFKWEALGTIFGRAPFYGAGYLFIPDPQNKMGITHFTHLPDFLERKWYYEGLKRDYETEKNGQEKNKLLKKVMAAQEDVQKIATTLVGNYKIHMMPTGSLTEILVMLLEAFDKDPELNRLVANVKLKLSPAYESGGQNFPLVVFYAVPGKNNAQRLLDKLYNIFKDMPGLNKRPRYNARVSDLLWVAQGDGDYKKGGFAEYYELPNLTYYRPDFTGKIQNYHLVHPGTGKEVVG